MAHGILSRSIDCALLAKDARALKSPDEEIQQRARQHIAERLGKMKGVAHKMGQVLSMGSDQDFAADFAPLAESVQALPFAHLKPHLEREWGRPIEEVVQHVVPAGIAASLGQVHRARLHDGREVAIKIQYPGIEKTVATDLKLLGLLSAPMQAKRRGFDLAAYKVALAEDLQRELDYRLEADSQEHIASLNIPGLIIPEVIREWSTERILVTTWEESSSLDDILPKLSSKERRTLGHCLGRIFFRSVFELGLVHADPHQGNVRFRQTDQGAKVVLFDFGCVAAVPKASAQALLDLVELAAGSPGDALAPFLALNFNEDLLRPIEDKLLPCCRVLFEPFVSRADYQLEQWNRAERMADILGEDRWNLRLSGPAPFLFIMRAFGGFVYYLEHLGEPISVAGILNTFRDPARRGLRKHSVRQQPSGPTHEALTGPRSSPPPAAPNKSLVDKLRIDVREGGRSKVSLTFKASLIDRIEDLIDENLNARLAKIGIDPVVVVQNYLADGLRPGMLFEIPESNEGREVRVWLE